MDEFNAVSLSHDNFGRQFIKFKYGFFVELFLYGMEHKTLKAALF